jgi:hypothetical protein
MQPGVQMGTKASAWVVAAVAFLLGAWVVAYVAYAVVWNFTDEDGSALRGVLWGTVGLAVPVGTELARRRARQRGTRGHELFQHLGLVALLLALGLAVVVSLLALSATGI